MRVRITGSVLVRRLDGSWRLRRVTIGASRDVFLIGRWAVKVPVMRYGWGAFLHGLLANMQEAEFAAADWPLVCPVIWAAPGGFVVIMRRAAPLTRPLYQSEREAFEEAHVPVEWKQDSFGWVDGRLVAVDYGN